MKPKHRNKALIGVTVWFALFAVSLATLLHGKSEPNWVYSIKSPTRIVAFVVEFVLLLVVYFWGCHHLAKARGYSTSVVFLGVLGPLVQLLVLTILLVLPDKAPEHTLRHRRKMPSGEPDPESNATAHSDNLT